MFIFVQVNWKRYTRVLEYICCKFYCILKNRHFNAPNTIGRNWSELILGKIYETHALDWPWLNFWGILYSIIFFFWVNKFPTKFPSKFQRLMWEETWTGYTETFESLQRDQFNTNIQTRTLSKCCCGDILIYWIICAFWKRR